MIKLLNDYKAKNNRQEKNRVGRQGNYFIFPKIELNGKQPRF